MVKRAALGLFTIIFCSGLFAQSTATLDANNVKAVIGADGTLFPGGLEIPKGSGLKSLGVAQLWIGGKHNGNLYMAARMFDTLKQNDFWPGPIDTTSANNAGDSNFWNKIYKITAAEIAQHRQNWNSQGYVMPASIKNWPGSNLTQQPFKKVLAAFVDFNANYTYEPEQGEFPVIKGDEAAYFIINDKANTHFATGGLPMGVEIHGLAYVFANNPQVANTVFLEVSFINRSANNYDSVFAGIWADCRLGAPGDEFISTFGAKNAFYCFNADSNDNGGYGVYPPAQATVFLNHPLQYTIEIEDNTAAGNMRGLPKTPQQFYNYLKRTWRDDKPLLEGADGYNGTTPTDLIYNGNPCSIDSSGWTESGSGSSKGRRTMIGSFGPLTLNSGAYIKLDVAFVWERSLAGKLASICELNKTVDNVKAFYNKNISSIHTVNNALFSVYPNPANQVITINGWLQQHTLVEIFDMQGRLVKSVVLGDEVTDMAVDNLTPGVYSIKLSSENLNGMQKLIIAH